MSSPDELTLEQLEKVPHEEIKAVFVKALVAGGKKGLGTAVKGWMEEWRAVARKGGFNIAKAKV